MSGPFMPQLGAHDKTDWPGVGLQIYCRVNSNPYLAPSGSSITWSVKVAERERRPRPKCGTNGPVAISVLLVVLTRLIQLLQRVGGSGFLAWLKLSCCLLDNYLHQLQVSFCGQLFTCHPEPSVSTEFSTCRSATDGQAGRHYFIQVLRLVVKKRPQKKRLAVWHQLALLARQSARRPAPLKPPAAHCYYCSPPIPPPTPKPVQ